jgi:glycosyltransferase involved in cell wall biosynthesis
MRNLILVLSSARSLQIWLQKKIISRELLSYEYLNYNTLVLSTNPKDSSVSLPNNIHCSSYSIFFRVQFLNFLSLFFRSMKSYRNKHPSNPIVFTHQLDDWIQAFLVSRLVAAPLILRAGYEYNYFAQKLQTSRIRKVLIYLYSFLAYQLATRIHITTEPARRYISRAFKVPSTKIAVIPNYVDSCFIRGSWSKPKQLLTFKILTIARLVDQKNLALILDALYILKENSIFEVELSIYGEGPLLTDLMNIIQAYGLNVKLNGLLKNQEIPVVMDKHHLFICSSKYEGHPKALLEALAYGIPVLCTNTPGVRSLVRHNHTGSKVKPTPASMARQIVSIIENYSNSCVQARLARSQYSRTCNISNVAMLINDSLDCVTI